MRMKRTKEARVARLNGLGEDDNIEKYERGGEFVLPPKRIVRLVLRKEEERRGKGAKGGGLVRVSGRTGRILSGGFLR